MKIINYGQILVQLFVMTNKNVQNVPVQMKTNAIYAIQEVSWKLMQKVD